MELATDESPKFNTNNPAANPPIKAVNVATPINKGFHPTVAICPKPHNAIVKVATVEANLTILSGCTSFNPINALVKCVIP